ncbi:uncharacterized protein YukE [Nocardia transvalensis]|uniref:Uncharacterized protein YukE n=1 Tax=Nocardia transvalensis TaxID=37333 RepID=A0A7W9UIY7_9NOCA|nr:hypothetical protein [Nocardia transvalensis]MBB5914687.1 uncharacterized protein YukE [Nocardia transvalensis]
MRATQPKFATLSDTVRTALADLKRVIDAEGECWGSDETGKSFAQNYTPGVGDGLTGIGALAGAVGKFGDSVTATANLLQQTDQEHAAALKQQQS